MASNLFSYLILFVLFANTIRIIERIRLNEKEKKALQNIALGNGYPPDGTCNSAYDSAVAKLADAGLVTACFNEMDRVIDASITPWGMEYAESYLKPRNHAG